MNLSRGKRPRRAITGAQRSPTRAIRSGALSMRKSSVSAPLSSSVQVTGIDTGARGRGANQPPPMFGNLKTVTKNLRPGYLRKNGVPYSDKTTLTEYWDLVRQPNGDQWIVITTVVEDPTYLARTWITSLNFKKEPNGSRWDPSPCAVR